jgi:hypothetical protein
LLRHALQVLAEPSAVMASGTAAAAAINQTALSAGAAYPFDCLLAQRQLLPPISVVASSAGSSACSTPLSDAEHLQACLSLALDAQQAALAGQPTHADLAAAVAATDPMLLTLTQLW